MIKDSRNIIDYYKYWEHDAIIADLDKKRHNFSVLCCNIQGDFNIGTVIRNANAFLAKEVIIYGKRQYDRRGTVGTHLYTHFKKVRDINELSELDMSSYHIVGIDNVEKAIQIEKYIWPKKHTLMIFGEENSGIPDEIKCLCQDLIYITQYGSVRSLNCGVASGVAMYDYCSKALV